VALAHEQAVAGEEARRHRIGQDLRLALREVGDDVQPRQPLERVRVDDVRRAGPVVADDEDVARLGGAVRSAGRQPCKRDDSEQDA
jgi:hypothetical protein